MRLMRAALLYRVGTIPKDCPYALPRWGGQLKPWGKFARAHRSRELVASLVFPAQNLFFDGKLFRQRAQELGRERKGMDLQGYREMRSRFHEALDPQFGVPSQSQQLDLRGVHQRVKQSPQRQMLVKDNHVSECDRIHMADCRRFEPRGTDLREKFWGSESGAVQFEHTSLLQQEIRKMRAQHGLVLRRQPTAHRQV